jgi:putative FmdB family regulatory protein
VPLYEYKCSECGNQYETREGFDAPARQICPKCGGMTKRLLFPPPIVFKGSGFYITDSRKGSNQVTVTDSAIPTATSAASPPAEKSDGASKSEPKPASASTSTDHDA